MGIQTIAQLDARRERDQVVANEAEVQNSFFEKHPELDRQCNWNIIRDGIGNQPVTVANAEQAAGANGSLLAAISPEELQAEQVQMADTICVSQFQKTFRPSERESWTAKVYVMTRDKRHRYLVQLPRMELKRLVELETCRPAILANIRASRPTYDPATILGGKQAYEVAINAQLEQYASMDIEQLGEVAVELRAIEHAKNTDPATLRAEVKADYESRHPESVGSSPVRPEDVKRFNERSQQVENRDNPDGVVIGYTAQELKSMALGEYRRLFMRNNGGSWFYKPGVEEAINKVLSGQETEAAHIRSEFHRTHIVA